MLFVVRSVYGAMLCNVYSLDLFIQAPRLMFWTDKSRPARLPAFLRKTQQSPTSEISLEHVCIVMFDVRQHLYGDFVFKDTFIQLSLMVQLDMSGIQRMIATCAIRVQLPHSHPFHSPLSFSLSHAPFFCPHPNPFTIIVLANSDSSLVCTQSKNICSQYLHNFETAEWNTVTQCWQ